MLTDDTVAPICLIFAAMLAACTPFAPSGESTPAPAAAATAAAASAVRASNDAASLLRNAAMRQLEQGHTELASSQLERSLRIEPDSVEGYFQLARVRVAQGFLSEARHLASKALSLIDSQGLDQRDLLTGLNKLLQRIAQLEKQ